MEIHPLIHSLIKFDLQISLQVSQLVWIKPIGKQLHIIGNMVPLANPPKNWVLER